MKEIEYLTFYNENKRKITFWIILTIISFIFFLGSLLAFLLTINFFNQNYLIPIGAVVSSIFLFIFLFILSCCLMPHIRRKKHIQSILTCKKVRYVGKIDSIDKGSAINKYASAYIISISDKKDKFKIFYDIDLEDLPFKVGNKIDVITGEGFILSYKVIK